MKILPLAGYRVIGLARGISRSCVISWRLFADLGAHVEVLCNSTCREVAEQYGLPVKVIDDITNELGRVVELLNTADALVLDRSTLHWLAGIGLDADGLNARFPQLVVACLSPFGMTGPMAHLDGGELLVEAASGVLWSNGAPEDPPLAAGVPVAALGGAILGTTAMIAALFERHRSGIGQFIDHADYDSVIAFSGTLLPTYFLSGGISPRRGNRHSMASPWNAYPTMDSWLIVCTMNDAQFHKLADAIDRPDLKQDERYLTSSLRVANAEELDEAVAAWSHSRTTDDALAALLPAGIAAGAVRDVEGVLADDHARYRGVVTGEPARAGPFLQFSRAATAHPRRRYERHPTAATGGPLEGIRIIEVSGHTAGPLAGRFLSLLGAEVVKVEPPKGEAARHLAQQVAGQGYLFHVNNTGKRDIALDITAPENALVLLDLLGTGDVFLTNLGPTTLAALGFSPAALEQRFPELVYTGLSGFGASGPRGGDKTFDMVVQAISGLMALTSNGAGEPRKIALSMADLLGACAAALGTSAALLERTRSGLGSFVDATLFDTTVWSTQHAWGAASRPDGHCLPCADGWIVIDGDLDRAAELAGRPEPGLSAWLRTLGSEDAERRLQEHGIAALRPRRIDEVAEAEQTTARGLLVEVTYLDEPIRVIGSPFHFTRSRSEVRTAAPELGADNASFLGVRST